MNNPKVSVIVPVYNTEEHLEKCLDSIVNQSLKEIEIIIVNDCTPDNSERIIQKYQEKDERIVYVKHDENLGLGGARNTGIKIAKADYIGSVDSDDWVAENMFELMYDKAIKHDADVVVCGVNTIDQDENIEKYYFFKEETLVTGKECFNSFFKHWDKKENVHNYINGSFWNKLWKKSLYIDNDIFFPNYVYHQDLATTPRILHFCNKVALIEECPHYYFQNTSSIVRTISEKHVNDVVEVMRIIRAFMNEHGLYEEHKEDFWRLFYLHRIHFHFLRILGQSGTDKERKFYLEFTINKLYEEIDFKDIALVLDRSLLKSILNGESLEKGALKALLNTAHRQVFESESGVKGKKKESVTQSVDPAEMDHTVPIVFAFDDNYAAQTGVVIESLLDNKRESTKYIIHCMHAPDLTEKNIGDLKETVKRFDNNEIVFTNMNDLFADAFEIRDISHTTYYRLMIHRLLDYDKVIYCDVDAIISDDLCEVYNTDLGDNYLGVVLKPYRFNQKHLDFIGVEYDEYFSGGFLLMNLTKIKQDSLDEQFLNLAKKKFTFQDQDILNISCKGRVKYLHYKYCFFANIDYQDKKNRSYLYEVFGEEETNEAINHPVTIQYAGPKPWNSMVRDQSLADLWWKYYDGSVFYDQVFKDKSFARIEEQTYRLGKNLKQLSNLDCDKKTRKSILFQRVPVRRLTPEFEHYVSSFSDAQENQGLENRYLALNVPFMHKPPTKNDRADVCVVTDDGNVRIIDHTCDWDFSNVADLQINPKNSDEVIYRVIDVKSKESRFIKYNLESNKKSTLRQSLPEKSSEQGYNQCSFSGDKRFMVHESFSYEGFPYRKLIVHDLKTKKELNLGYFLMNPELYNNHDSCRCDLRPRWTGNGKYLVIDSIHEGFRGIYQIKNSDILDAFGTAEIDDSLGDVNLERLIQESNGLDNINKNEISKYSSAKDKKSKKKRLSPFEAERKILMRYLRNSHPQAYGLVKKLKSPESTGLSRTVQKLDGQLDVFEKYTNGFMIRELEHLVQNGHEIGKRQKILDDRIKKIIASAKEREEKSTKERKKQEEAIKSLHSSQEKALEQLKKLNDSNRTIAANTKRYGHGPLGLFSRQHNVYNYVLSAKPQAISEIEENKICIDCGSHMGVVTEVFLRLGAKVYAFEPNIYLSNLIRYRLNEYVEKRQLEVVNAAVWNKDETTKLYFREGYSESDIAHIDSESSSIIKEKTNTDLVLCTSEENYKTVQAIDLAKFISALNKEVHILKLDIEGAEYEVLDHIIDTGIYKKISYIFVEPHHARIPELVEPAERLMAKIKEMGIENISFDWR